MDGKSMGLQLIYGGKTNQSLPRYQFPKDFLLNGNPKHYSNEKESKSYCRILLKGDKDWLSRIKKLL